MSLAASKEHMTLLAEVALHEWSNAGESEYASWFDKIYLSDEWSGWFAMASGIPGTGVTNNPLESLNKAIKDTVDKRVSLEFFMEISIPAILKLCADNFCKPMMSHDVAKYQMCIFENRIHRNVLESARDILFDKRNVITMVESGQTVTYVNSSRFLVQFHDSNAVSIPRVTAYNTSPRKRLSSFSDAEARVLSLHRVRRVHASDGHRTYYCNCKGFYHSCYCAHVVVCCQIDARIDVFNLLSALMPTKKKGRPTNRGKALQRMEDDNFVTAVAPSSWRASDVRHPEFLNGVVSGQFTYFYCMMLLKTAMCLSNKILLFRFQAAPYYQW
jgi:hypothetical protein